MATLIAIDYGEKKIGFAVGQTITGTSNPLTIVMQNNETWGNIDKIIKTWKPTVIVIGKPELADGNQHPLEKKIEGLIIKLKTSYNIRICRENEAYSSVEARMNISNKHKNKPIDSHAAAIFLESWMRVNDA